MSEITLDVKRLNKLLYKQMEPRYLNVDCILRSNEDLTPLVKCIEPKVLFLWREFSDSTSFIGFETTLINTRGPDEDILELFRLFDSLPEPVIKLLNNSHEKVLDIGFESGNSGDPTNVCLSADVIARIYNYGFSINIRVYPLV